MSERYLKHVWWFAPQIIDYARLGFALPLIFLQPDTSPESGNLRLFCASCYCISHFLDFIDGRVARAYNQCSHFGILLDHTLDIFTTVFMALALASEHKNLLNFLLWDSASYVIVVMLLINRAIQNGRLREAPKEYTANLTPGTMGKWNVPYCVENGGFLIGGHFLFMFHQVWLAMLYMDYDMFAPTLGLGVGTTWAAFCSTLVCRGILGMYYAMVVAICYQCLDTYSEPGGPAPVPAAHAEGSLGKESRAEILQCPSVDSDYSMEDTSPTGASASASSLKED